MDMPERAVIPLMVAVSAAFIAGVIAAVLQLHGGAAVLLGLAAGAVVLVAGVSSVAGGDAPERDKNLIGALRGGLGVGLFVFVYVGTLAFLRDGSVGVALLCYLLAGAYGLLITRVRWRSGEGEKEPLPVRMRREHGTQPRGPASGGGRARRRPRRSREELAGTERPRDPEGSA